MIAEYDGSDTLLRKFIYGPGIDEPICMITYAGGNEDGRYFYHFDALGSVAALSQFDTTQAAIVEAYSYSAFGQPTVHTADGDDDKWLTSDDSLASTPVSVFSNPYLFTGRQWDGETGLYYYRARMYSPDLGRFLQPDPIGYADSMNLYQYCLNNPVNWTDPFGLRIVMSENASWRDRWAYKRAVKKLSKTALFRNTYEYLSREDTPDVYITFASSGDVLEGSRAVTEGGLYLVYWNRHEELQTYRGNQSPVIGLAHEMEHIRIDMIGGIKAPPVEINGRKYNPVEE